MVSGLNVSRAHSVLGSTPRRVSLQFSIIEKALDLVMYTTHAEAYMVTDSDVR